ncbi:MAG: DUF5309 family protein, partial [Phycisphaerales bacterium]|nr:DUF5309 family protein [Phycisphaerales bacterium]
MFNGKTTYDAGPTLPEIADDVADLVSIIGPHETPLLDHLGSARAAARSTVHEWLEDALLPNTDTITETVFDPDPSTATRFEVGHPSRFREGDLVRPGDAFEVMRVVRVLGTDLEVERGYGATPRTALSTGMGLSIVSNAAVEGADAPEARFTTRVRRQNWTQIFTATVSVSGTMQASNTIGVTDELEYQKAERLRELLRDLENAVINGVANAASPMGADGQARSMNGIIQQISTHRFIPGVGDIPPGEDGQLTEEVLNAALRVVWENAGPGIDTIVCGGTQKRRLNGFASAARAYVP